MPDDATLADLGLLLRGVRLPLDVLGGRVQAGGELTVLDRGLARLRIPSALAERVEAAGDVTVADEEGRPIATLSGLSVVATDDQGILAEGRVRPADPTVWAPISALPGGDDGAVTVLLAARPLLLKDLERVRSLRGGVVALAVPVAEASRDGLPAATLLGLIQRALADSASGQAVHVVPVELARRDAATDAAIARAVAQALGAREATPLADGDQDWVALLSALDTEDALPALADDATLRELRRWRPARGRRGVVILLTGLSGSGKSTLARALAHHIRETTDRTVSLLDGDLVRRLLSSGLGFDHASRDLNVRRIGFVAAEVARHGGIAICAPIAPYAESRAAVRAMAEQVGDFVLVHVSTPLAECERRDVKGLYARARAGLIDQFTGVSDPYDDPADADLTVDTSALSVEEALGRLAGFLRQQGWLQATAQEG